MKRAMLTTAAVAVAVAALVLTVLLVASRDGEASSSSVTTMIAEQDVPAVIGAERADWSIVFDDPFDGDSLSASWTTCYWWQVDGGCTIASNDELEWYRPEGASVAGGVLQLEAVVSAQRTTDGNLLPYRSGMASTGPPDDNGSAAGFSFTHGYVEATVRFPDGDGTWPAVWLLSADRTSLPEIDIAEIYEGHSTIKSRVHQRIDGEGQSQGLESTLISTADGWHRVGVLWTKDRVEFYVDDVLTGTVDDPTLVPQTSMYLIVNLAVGGLAGPVDDDEAFPQIFEIDRITVWQQKEST